MKLGSTGRTQRRQKHDGLSIVMDDAIPDVLGPPEMRRTIVREGHDGGHFSVGRVSLLLS
jgi:hypothetical protein